MGRFWSVISLGDHVNLREMTHLKHQAQDLVLSRTPPPPALMPGGYWYLGLPVLGPMLRRPLALPSHPQLAPCLPSGALPGLSSARAPGCQGFSTLGRRREPSQQAAASHSQQSQGLGRGRGGAWPHTPAALGSSPANGITAGRPTYCKN